MEIKKLNRRRINLHSMRYAKRLTQSEMADLIGCTRNCYTYVESGRSNGTSEFWSALQKAFNIPDSEMYSLMKKEGDEQFAGREKSDS